MNILISLCILCSLPRYEVIVDPVLLDQLYESPFSQLEVLAIVSFNGSTGDCTIAFRGGSSLWCEKKSWHIRVDNPDLFPAGNHILLNAQFRDPSLIRNTIGLYLTRKLGFACSETEFCSFSINNANMGVYERVEAIDRFFYERNDLSFGPLFKSTDVYGRLSHHFSDTTAIAGFEAKIDSDPYEGQLLRLIEDCFREDVSSLKVSEILAAFAVNTAIGDQDGIITNYYLHCSNSLWHYYPWDRDASFGNSWQGTYDSLWITRLNITEIGLFGATRGILSIQENRNLFNSIIAQTVDVFQEDLPGFVDSLRLLIRYDLAYDPFYKYDVAQFDSICSRLSEDILARADFLSGFSLEDEFPGIESISISSCLDMGFTIDISVSLLGDDPFGVICMESSGNQSEQLHMKNQTSSGESWTLTLEVPPEAYSVHMAFGPFGISDHLMIFYPSWAMRDYENRPDPTPSARVALADLSPDLLSPGSPVWCGAYLWVLPVMNTSDQVQDISLCRFQLGNPSGNVFIAESILVGSHEMFYLTNSRRRAETIYTEHNIYGDAGTSYPQETTLTLMDPSWNPIYSWQIEEGDSLPEIGGLIIPSEVSAEDEWVELFNNSEYSVDVSRWYLMDSEKNISFIPDDFVLLPGEILLATACPDSFENLFCKVVPLDFNLMRSRILSLYTLS